MRIISVFLFLTFSLILTSFNSSSITVNARLIKKFKVEFAEKEGATEFLKFKILETDNIFLVSPDRENHDKDFFKKNRIYEITYGEGGLWNEFEGEIKHQANKDIEKYPFHFLLDIKRKN